MQAVNISAPQSSGASWDPARLPADLSIPKPGTPQGHSVAGLQKPLNYTSFSEVKVNKSVEAIAANAGYERHPELGLLFPGAPCSDCYEVLGERTENTKTFVNEGTTDGKKHKYTQTSTQPMHYKDAAGNWRTIITHLQADVANKGIYTVSEEATPVTINTNAGSTFSSLGKSGESIQFNRNLELIYVQPDGKEINLGVADYTHHTAGDQGMYITNAWPGVDIEMNVLRGAIKTNFHINHALPEYAAGKLLIRDHLEMDKGLSLYAQGQDHLTGELQIQNRSGMPVYGIGAANVYGQDNGNKKPELLEYIVSKNNILDIALPGSYLGKAVSAYPLIIDPLVTQATTTAVTGSSYYATLSATSGCAYLNAAMTPANCTITDVQFAFGYETTSPMAMEYAGTFFYLGTCRSPGTLAGGLIWACNSALPGTCTAAGGTTYSMFSDLESCLPAPSCTSIPLNITMYFFQDYENTTACATIWCYSSAPLVITVNGETVALGTGTAAITASPATICNGASSTLTGSGIDGVPPYTFSWAPAGVTGSPATVSPAVTTTYTLTVTDACGNVATGTKKITVNPSDPITGTTTLCVGTTSTLADAAGTGTWTSGATTVASVGSTSGIVGGIAAGTSPITFTATGGCASYATVTVTPPPVAITGIDNVCAGSTTTLSDATSGSTWSSSNTAVASVDPATGIVTGIDSGVVTITYGVPGCEASVTYTVNPTPAVSGITFTNPLSCNSSDGTVTLSGLNASNSYSVSYSGPSGSVAVSIISDAGGNIVITGLPAGTYSSFVVTNSSGCPSNVSGPVTLVSPGVPATPVGTNSSPICQGADIDFTTTDGTAGVSYSWTGPNGFSSAAQDPVLTSATLGAAGTYTVVAILDGCNSAPATTVVVVNANPVLSVVSFTDPSTCQGTDGSITLYDAALQGGTAYSVSYVYNGAPYITSVTSNGSGDIIIPGLSSGSYTGISATSGSGCLSNIIGPVTLTDPGAPPAPVLGANLPLCVGQTLYLTATDSTEKGIYIWTFPDGTIDTTQNLTIPNTSYSDSGIFTVSYDVFNCFSTSTIDIPLYPPIVLTGITGTSTVAYGGSIQLNATGALYYWWMPDNGTLSNPNINDPVATPTAPTVYTVVGTSIYGCMDTAYVSVSVDTTTSVFIPTAFTPNGDGLNDVFKIGNLKHMQLVDFSIFNRWGQLVYHNTYNASQGWDGTFNGVAQDIGVYNYVVTLSYPDGGTQSFKGDVTLIR